MTRKPQRAEALLVFRVDEMTGSLWNAFYICNELESVIGASARKYFEIAIVVIHRFIVSVPLVLVKK